MKHYMTVSEGKIVARTYEDDRQVAEVVLRSMEDFYEYMRKNGIKDIMCSSSLDFPNEFTSDAATIELAHQIRGGA